MYKYVGTEPQLLDLGFKKFVISKKAGSYGFSILIDDLDCIEIYNFTKEVAIDTDNTLGLISQNTLKFFVDLVERGLIVWVL